MGRRKNLSDFDNGQMIVARLLGRSLSITARLAGCSRSAVVSTYLQWSEEGQTTNRRQDIWRPRRSTVAQVAENFNDGYRSNVSQRTVHRTLLLMGLRSCRSVRVPMLTPVHRRNRLQWARQRRKWTLEDWKKVA
ncbi:hypothetical protein JZ751_029745 [Albula glossodonta]|uniref:Transposase Tc1-like domain-containing protein n=1 Tax=Albula glossodonta TaxID=121402 RepID=A0A8T2NB34_9TELE|nr:hypothetical protein JZ751_029745 [Albula glossodonta]